MNSKIHIATPSTSFHREHSRGQKQDSAGRCRYTCSEWLGILACLMLFMQLMIVTALSYYVYQTAVNVNHMIANNEDNMFHTLANTRTLSANPIGVLFPTAQYEIHNGTAQIFSLAKQANTVMSSLNLTENAPLLLDHLSKALDDFTKIAEHGVNIRTQWN